MPRRLAVLLSLALLLLGAPVRAQPNEEADRAYRRGVSLLEAGKLEEAAREFEKVLELAERALGPDDPRLAVDLNNLGEVYRRMGRLDRAAELLRRAIRLDEAAGGRGPALATSLNNLGLVLRAQGRLDTAADLYRRALALLENSLGPDHPDTARALNNLAQLELERGDVRNALSLQERAARIARASLGAEHATTKAIEAALSRTRAAAGVPATTAPPASPSAAPTGSRPSPATAVSEGAPRSLAVPPAREVLPPPGPGLPTPTPAPLATAPARPAAPKSVRPTTGSSGARLHLGSIGDPSRLEAEWKRLTSRHPSLAGLSLLPPERVELAGRGTFWRVLAGPLASREAGTRICTEITAKGDPCVVLGP
ncbi:MAG: tetratricopeptide repeat protein [Geminicoccaceae bacterium]|nr:tetratricopeptide repeat protein [Geminicoccaceae bacterium]